MSQRTDDNIIFEHTSNQPVSKLAVRQLILSGSIGPAVRARRNSEEPFQALGAMQEYRALFHQLQPEHRLSQVPLHTPWLVWGVIGLMFRVYLLSWRDNAHWQFQGLLMNDYASILELGQWYRLWSAAVFHQSLPHFLLNACLIGYLGFHIELRLGAVFFGALVMLSIGTGSILSLLSDPMTSSVGGSALVYAVLVFAIGMGLRDRTSSAATSAHLGWPLVPYLILAVGLGAANTQLDHPGHLGGALVGMIFVLAIMKDGNSFRIRWFLPKSIAVMVALLIITALWRGYLWVPLVPNTDSYGLMVTVPQYWKSGWGSTGEQAWLSPTVKAQLSTGSIIHPQGRTTVKERLETRLQQLGQVQTIHEDGSKNLGGSDGWLWSGTIQQAGGVRSIWLYVLCRGQLEHYVVMSVAYDERERYTPYWSRILDTVRVQQPERLWTAKQTSSETEKAEDIIQYAFELKLIGHVPAALDEYNHALRVEPSSTQAMVGRLQCLQELNDPTLSQAINEAESWMLYSEELAEVLMQLATSEQRERWLPALKVQYSGDLWLKHWLVAEE